MPVKFPDMRADLLQATRDLSDERFHCEVWTHPTMPPPDNRFPFGEAISYIVDDLDMAHQQSLVGTVLTDETELALFLDLSSALNAMLNRIGPHATYVEASASPEWDQVKSAARTLAEKLSTNIA
jgi:hypothetical protein